MVEWGLRRSRMCCGANPFKALKTNGKIWNLILYLTGNQYSSGKTEMMFSCFLVPVTVVSDFALTDFELVLT